jgi:hypothetical protein
MCWRGFLARRAQFSLPRPFAKLDPCRHSLRLLALEVIVKKETYSSGRKDLCKNLKSWAATTMSTDNDSASTSGGTETDDKILKARTYATHFHLLNVEYSDGIFVIPVLVNIEYINGV